MLHTVVIASANPGKLKEFRALFADCACEVIAQSEYAVPDVDETGLSFIENAILKARNAAAHSGLPAIADDSGLSVDYLAGAPGIYSARYSVGDATFGHNPADPGDSIDAANNRKLLAALDGVAGAKRAARFICALAFIAHADDPTPIVCTAEWRGRILESARGSAGFGYDPLFYVPEFDCSSASLDPAIKNANSHRGKAMRALLQLLAQQKLL